MKHYINLSVSFFKDDIKDFTITDAETYQCLDNSISTNTSIIDLTHYKFITEDAYQKYKNENKIYYMHWYDLSYILRNYNLVFNSFEQNRYKYVFPIIFLYINGEYHCCAILDELDHTHLVDITSRLHANFNYWKNSYTENKLDKDGFVINNDSYVYTTYFYDSYDECKEAMFSYMMNNAKILAGIAQLDYLTLNNERLYEKAFNKRYEEECEKIKRQIKEELDIKKDDATSNISKYNKLISKLTEYNQKTCVSTKN